MNFYQTGKLSIAPIKVVADYFPDIEFCDPDDIVKYCAIALNEFCN